MTFYADDYEPLIFDYKDNLKLEVSTLYFGRYSETSRNKHVAWLIEDDEVIAYISFITGGDEIPMLADIETRDEYRGKGYARVTVAAVEALVGEKIYTSGSYTPLGYERLRGFLTNSDPTKVVDGPIFRNQTFVESWENRWRKTF